MKTSELLIAAKAKIANPVNWIQGLYAADAKRERTSPTSVEAVCFCSMGAVYSVESMKSLRRIAEIALDNFANDDIVGYNDAHTHEQVMAVWDKAIAAALAEGAA